MHRHFSFSEAKRQPFSEINLQTTLEGPDMDMSQVKYHPLAELSSADF